MARRRRIEYEDFAVRIAPDGSGGFESRILRAPGGGGSATFVPPFDSDEIQPLLRDLGRTIRSSARDPVRHLEAAAAPEHRRRDPQEVGTRLFEALFRGAVLVSFARSQPRRGDPGLRIRLVIDPLIPGCAEIAALPWELLYDPGSGRFLSRLHRFPVVRFLESPGAPTRPRPVEGDLRVLVAICSPGELSPLDVSSELEAAERWGAIRGVQVEIIEHATFDQVRRRLQREEFHVFHFSGHGETAGPDGHDSLVFNRPDGGSDCISARLLADHLDNAPSLRLAVLNACSSGRIPRRSGIDPFGGVATALVRSAVPAVIGMQYPISDQAAARFGEAFYKSLADGDPIDAAVAEGRLAILQGDSTSLEWATPALHLRVADGHIFERAVPVRPWRRWLAAGIAILAAAAAATALWLGRDHPTNESEITGIMGAAESEAEYQRPRVESAVGCPPPPDLPGMAFVLVPPGKVEVADPGSPDGIRTVALDRPLCVAAFETTVSEWQLVMGIDEQKDEDGLPHWQYHPASRILWEGAQEFLRRVNLDVRGAPFRLPTNDEWEYFARGNHDTRYFFGDDPEELTRYGNCSPKMPPGDGFERHTAPVGSFEPNPFGLYDVYGNLWEWVTGPAEVPEGTSAEDAGVYRIKRGGSFSTIAESCTSSTRSDVQGDRRDRANGFRVVREVAGPEA